MLLSVPTWIIHLLTVTEWLTAMLLFQRYGQVIGDSRLRVFALCMTPHLLGGSMILLFHLGGDSQPVLLDLARALTFVGSLLLFAASLSMALLRWPQAARLAWLIAPLGFFWAILQWLDGATSRELLRGANLSYVAFLLSLLAVYRVDRRLFSPLSIGGFWFLLVFVAVTIWSTQIATLDHGLPSLSHHDLLHGLSESLLSVSNFLIALGAWRRLRSTTLQSESLSS